MSLNEGFRFAVVLCDLLGFPYDEAAEILGVQEGTIKSRIFRAREALAAALTEAGYGLPGERNPGSGTASHRRVQRGNEEDDVQGRSARRRLGRGSRRLS